MRKGRPDFDKLGLAFPEGAQPLPGHKMRKGRPDFDKLGLAFSLKNP